MPPEMQFMTAHEVAKLLGVHTATIWRWVESGQFIKPVRLTRKVVRFPVLEVQKFLETKTAARQEEINK